MSAKRGNADAHAVVMWMENFLAGRFLAGDRGFNPRDGCAYNIAVRRGRGTPFQTWAEIGRETVARNLSNGNGWSNSQGDYGRWALQSLAALIEVLDSPRARTAYAWLSRSNPPFTDVNSFSGDPTLAIVPP